MSDVISRALVGTALLVQWYQWGVIVGFVVALAITVWIFVDAQRAGQDATVWKSLAAVASVIGIPALLARVHAGFALEMRDSLLLLAIFSIAGAVLALAAAIGYAGTRSRTAAVCPVCGQPQDPTWTHCPYHSSFSGASPLTPVVARAPISDPAPPVTHLTPLEEPPMSATSSPRDTLIAGLDQSAANAGAPVAPHRGTMILGLEPATPPLALLVIKSGPYINTTLSLKAGVNTIGRDGRVNDHPIDDVAVSERHLSIRFQDGRFTATDLDSTNGTFVNNKPIARQTLESNDVIRLGKTDMVFVQVNQSVPSDDHQPSAQLVSR